MDTQRRKTLARFPLFIPLLLLLSSAAEVRAQNAVQQSPDCVIFFSWTQASGATPLVSPGLANYGPGSPNGPAACTTWILAYATFGTVTGVSLRVESAPAATINTPGTFVAYAGTVTTGVNPNTSTAGAQTTLDNNLVAIPWIRVALNTFTGSGTRGVFGMLEGWNKGNGSGGSSGGGCVGTIATPCIVAGPDASGAVATQSPVLIAGFDTVDVRTIATNNQGQAVPAHTSNANIDSVANTNQGLTDETGNKIYNRNLPYVFNGSTWDRQFACTNQAQVTISAGTDVVIVSGVASTNIRICHLDFSADATSAVTIRQGTGTTCGTNTAALAGPYQNILGLAEDFTPLAALRTTVAARDVCLHFSASVTAGGTVIYAQY